MDNRDFDQLLEKRHTPEAPSNLSARIIEASRNLSQEAKQPWFAGVLEFMQGFAIPQPALAFAMVLVLGLSATFGVGIYGNQILSVEPTATYYSEADDVELAFYLDDIFEVDY